MPCKSYESEWAVHSDSSEILLLKAEADRLARIACVAMDMLKKHDPSLTGMNTEALAWYKTHTEADKKRIAAETKAKAKKAEVAKLRKEALAKLTPEEIKVFGIEV
jgi:hypothetical protein